MAKNLVGQLFSIARLAFADEQDIEDAPEQERIKDAVEAARIEWQQAREFFEDVTDPDLVDYAIHSLQAAERKYMYLLKQAKHAGASDTVLGGR